MILGALLIGACLWGWVKLQDPHSFPVRHIKIRAYYYHITPNQLRDKLKIYNKSGFFGVSLNKIKQTLLQTLPWVESVSITRQWPDTLNLKLTEKVAVASWRNGRLYSEKGELFQPRGSHAISDKLPHLDGPNNQAAGRLFDLYKELHALLALQDLSVKQLTQDKRGSIVLVCYPNDRAAQPQQPATGRDDPHHRKKRSRGAMTVYLGQKKADALARLARFLRHYPSLLAQHKGRQLRRVDLRYPNGFSVLFD